MVTIGFGLVIGFGVGLGVGLIVSIDFGLATGFLVAAFGVGFAAPFWAVIIY